MHVAKAQKISQNTGRPKASDYDPQTRELILSAANLYRALLATQGAFPTSSEELDLVKKAWKRVNDENELTSVELTPDIMRIVSFFFFPSLLPVAQQLLTHFRGQGTKLSGPWRGEKQNSKSC